MAKEDWDSSKTARGIDYTRTYTTNGGNDVKFLIRFGYLTSTINYFSENGQAKIWPTVEDARSYIENVYAVEQYNNLRMNHGWDGKFNYYDQSTPQYEYRDVMYFTRAGLSHYFGFVIRSEYEAYVVSEDGDESLIGRGFGTFDAAEDCIEDNYVR